MKPAFARKLRVIAHFFGGIAFAILVTGGGRLGTVDFISLNAWVLVALLPALALARAGEPILFPSVVRFRNRVAARPLAFALVILSLLALTHLAKFLTLHVGVFDAGYVYQGLFQAFRGPVLKCDVCYGGSYLGAHLAFTFALLSPLAACFRTPLAVPILQAAIGFACFAVLYRAFRAELDRRAIAFVFFMLLAMRGIRESFLFDFREDLLGALFYALAFSSVKRGKTRLAIVPFTLAAFSKESAAMLLPFAMVAALFVGRKPKRRDAILYGLFGSAIAAFVLFGLLPHFTPASGGGSDLVKRLAYLGSTPAEIGSTLLGHPFESALAIFGHVATWERLRYLLIILGPLALVAARAPNAYYLPGIVLLFGNLLSEAATQRMMQFHYEILLLPFFGFGLAESVRRLRNSGTPSRNFYSLTLLVALAVSGTWPISHLRTYLRDAGRIADAFWVAQQASRLDSRETVVGDTLSYPFLTGRPEIRLAETYPVPAGALSGMGSLPVSDARYALLQKENGDRAGPEWDRIDCSPARIFCLYRRR